MILAIMDILSEYWPLGLIALFLLLLIVSVSMYVESNRFTKGKNFRENMYDAKTISFIVHIDYDENIVERYYIYDSFHKLSTLSIDGFFLRFDQKNVERLQKWMETVAAIKGERKTHGVEVIMLDDDGSRSIYQVELENYVAEPKNFYLSFVDKTDSDEIVRRLEKNRSNLVDIDEFYQQSNEQLCVADDGTNYYLIAIKYKEFARAKKELQQNMVKLIAENIYNRVSQMKFDRDLLCLSDDGTILLFSTNVGNEKKLRSRIRKIISKCSGEYEIVKNKFNYTITVGAGITKLTNQDKISMDKIIEAESACDFALNKNTLNDRIQEFDEELKKLTTEENNRLLDVEKAINEELFKIVYEPIIKTKDKKLSGYFVKIELQESLNISYHEFIRLAKQRYFRMAFYVRIFNKLLENKIPKSQCYYLSFDFDDMDKVMDAYLSNTSYKSINIIFCLEFTNDTLRNNDITVIERKIESYQKEVEDIKFGITYNNSTPVYLNSNIYSKLSCSILRGNLIEEAFDQFNNETLISVYTQLANKYNHDLIGLTVTNTAIYELYNHFNISKVGGDYITQAFNKENQKITDPNVLKVLKEIEERTY